MSQLGLPAANGGPKNVHNKDVASDSASCSHSPQTKGWGCRRAKQRDIAPTQEAGGCGEELPLT